MVEYMLKDREPRERLAAIEGLLDPGTIRLLEGLGIGGGWDCLEVGGGGGSIAAWLCQRVGGAGRVLVTDIDTRYLDALDAANLEVRRHDITSDDLPGSAFDLIHVRAVLEHLTPAGRASALRRMVAALKPDGSLLAESGDYVSWTPATQMLPERAAFFAKLSAAVFQALPPLDFFYGRHLAEELQEHGLVMIASEGRVALVRGGSPVSRIWGTVWATLGERITASGRITKQELERFVSLHHDPSFAWLGPICVAAWGRRPG
jgi:hypothetical protein